MWLCRAKMKHTLGIFRWLLVISLACKTYLWLCMCVEREIFMGSLQATSFEIKQASTIYRKGRKCLGERDGICEFVRVSREHNL